MTRTVHRSMPDGAMQAAFTYLTARLDKARASLSMGSRTTGSYSVIAERCRTQGDLDDSGSYTWTLPSPVRIDARVYTGFRLQARQPSPCFDEDAARALIDSLPEEDRRTVTRTEVVYDFDQLFLLRQQGKISDQDLDPVIITPPKEYSLVVVETK